MCGFRISAFCFQFLVATVALPQAKNVTLPLAAAAELPPSTLMNINNISMWVNADGRMGIDPANNAGTVFPKGTAPVIFADGIVWGGDVQDGMNPPIRVGGRTYTSGTVPGAILSPGVAEEPNAPDVRIWRIRPDYATADLSDDAFVKIVVFNIMGRSVKTLYKGVQAPGRYTVSWNGHDRAGRQVASGTYIIQMLADNFARARTVQLLR